MPFGLAAAPATFQRAMEQALAGLTYSICICYLDDIIIFSNSITEHCNRLRAVLRGSPCKNRPLEFLKITEFLHTFCVEEVIHKMNKKR